MFCAVHCWSESRKVFAKPAMYIKLNGCRLRMRFVLSGAYISTGWNWNPGRGENGGRGTIGAWDYSFGPWVERGARDDPGYIDMDVDKWQFIKYAGVNRWQLRRLSRLWPHNTYLFTHSCTLIGCFQTPNGVRAHSVSLHTVFLHHPQITRRSYHTSSPIYELSCRNFYKLRLHRDRCLHACVY